MVFRERRPSRHRAVDSDPADLVPEDELESYLAAISPDADGDRSESTGRFGTAQVFPVRLPALRTEQLQRLATERGVSATSLVVDWVIERLDREAPGHVSSPLESSPLENSPHAGSTPPESPTVERTPLGPPAPPRADDVRPPGAHHAPEAPLSPIDQLNPVGEVTAVEPDPGDPAAPDATPVTPLFGSAAHAAKPEDRSRGPRHRAPEPVTSLLTRRKF